VPTSSIPGALEQWIEHQYSAIEQRAKAQEGGEIHWGDETALVNVSARGRRCAPRGKTENLGVHHCTPVKAWLAEHKGWTPVG
jgi:hypothetical protein